MILTRAVVLKESSKPNVGVAFPMSGWATRRLRHLCPISVELLVLFEGIQDATRAWGGLSLHHSFDLVQGGLDQGDFLFLCHAFTSVPTSVPLWSGGMMWPYVPKILTGKLAVGDRN
jgi:hypothetical protein